MVVENFFGLCSGCGLLLCYDGYGGCLLIVECGWVVLVEFGYVGKLLLIFLLEFIVVSCFVWLFKCYVLFWVYWNVMFKGWEWLVWLGC